MSPSVFSQLCFDGNAAAKHLMYPIADTLVTASAGVNTDDPTAESPAWSL